MGNNVSVLRCYATRPCVPSIKRRSRLEVICFKSHLDSQGKKHWYRCSIGVQAGEQGRASVFPNTPADPPSRTPASQTIILVLPSGVKVRHRCS